VPVPPHNRHPSQTLPDQLRTELGKLGEVDRPRGIGRLDRHGGADRPEGRFPADLRIHDGVVGPVHGSGDREGGGVAGLVSV
jgi:hypothetical protein